MSNIIVTRVNVPKPNQREYLILSVFLQEYKYLAKDNVFDSSLLLYTIS